jgi:hypothetical protein
MKGFTILQPSAQAMLEGEKLWENRSRPAPRTVEVGEWIALHTGRVPWRDAQKIRELWPACPPDEELWFGCVIGAWRFRGNYPAETARRAFPLDAKWAFGPHCYRVGDTVRIEPMPCRGMQGWWTVPPDIELVLRRTIAKER